MAGTVEDVLRIARSQIGVASGRKYFEEMGDAWWGQAYCARFGRWVFWKADVDCHWDKDYAFDERDVPQAYRVGKYNLQPAYPLCFDWDFDGAGDHYGIVESTQDWGVVTVEGNTNGGKVDRQQRLWSTIICGIRPDLADARPVDTRIAVDGIGGHETVRALQLQLGTTPDGVISDQLWPHDQYRANVYAIEHYHLDYADYAYQGSALVKAIQRRVGVTADGDWGYNTTCALQRQLKAWGYYKGDIDADFGYHSVECLQRSINDGKWSE